MIKIEKGQSLYFFRSNDGLILLITSSDCYCTVITFDSNELGVPLASDKLPPNLSVHTECSKVTTSPSSVSGSENETEISHKPSPSSETLPVCSADSAITTVKPRRIRPTLVSTTPTRSSEALPSSEYSTANSLSSSASSTDQPNSTENPSGKSKDDQGSSSTNKDGTKVPRRVSFTTLTTYPAKQSSNTSSKGEQKDNDCIVIE